VTWGLFVHSSSASLQRGTHVQSSNGLGWHVWLLVLELRCPDLRLAIREPWQPINVSSVCSRQKRGMGAIHIHACHHS